jgi:hypothetical protein
MLHDSTVSPFVGRFWIQNTVQDDDEHHSTFDPGGHLACFDAAGLLPFDLARIAGDAASWEGVLALVFCKRRCREGMVASELGLGIVEVGRRNGTSE